ncbi:hypothetical protein Pst134EA_030537 [Puccinia striiformis f. sp. tritici]|uniref:hypothetical protein n=1 Tax=Puccinia striiformis f. sp. tritici TaxID=168172 RepID=UPI0020075A14|nr:hypothetical protein Pst134EA_030537 [Puccinia striiformis f. sp. tritici]KAH9446626.1 hypothetical protein Pst134EA_030537 [Puccinia striiformis f. sp. tritici]
MIRNFGGVRTEIPLRFNGVYGVLRRCYVAHHNDLCVCIGMSISTLINSPPEPPAGGYSLLWSRGIINHRGRRATNPSKAAPLEKQTYASLRLSRVARPP